MGVILFFFLFSSIYGDGELVLSLDTTLQIFQYEEDGIAYFGVPEIDTLNYQFGISEIYHAPNPHSAPVININSLEDINHSGNFEPEDVNFVDDDGDGFVDNIYGYNVLSSPTYWTNCFNSNQPYDEYGHGTAVIGVAAARKDCYGIVGVAPEAKVEIAKIGCSLDFHDNLLCIPFAELFALIQGILYLGGRVDVINISAGSRALPQSAKYTLDAIFDYFVSYYNTVFVAAVGNTNTPGDDPIAFPASSQWVIGVGASNEDDYRCDYSLYDPNPPSPEEGVEVVAPVGDGILTTTVGCRDADTTYYNTFSGTSLASPQMASAIALLFSQMGHLSLSEIRERLANSCRKPEHYEFNDEGWNPEVGYGILYLPPFVSEGYRVTMNPGKIEIEDIQTTVGETTIVYVNVKVPVWVSAIDLLVRLDTIVLGCVDWYPESFGWERIFIPEEWCDVIEAYGLPLPEYRYLTGGSMFLRRGKNIAPGNYTGWRLVFTPDTVGTGLIVPVDARFYLHYDGIDTILYPEIDTGFIYVVPEEVQELGSGGAFRLKVSPNSIKLFLSEEADFEIFNVSGRKIKSFSLKPGLNKISLNSFRNGVYFLKLRTKDKVILKKFWVLR